MTLEKYIKELQAIKDELKNKEVLVKQENGLHFEPEIKFKMKDPFNVGLTKENVTAIIIQ